MRAFRLGMAIWVAAALANTVAGGAAEPDEPLRVTLDLYDGSRVIGAPRTASVAVRTSEGKREIPLEQLASLRMEADREHASLELATGEHLAGVLDLASFALMTRFGEVVVGTEHLRHLRVGRTDGALPAGLQKGLILYYPCDSLEGGKAVDRSGRGHNGSIRAGVDLVAEGVVGGAYRFDGKAGAIRVGELGDLLQGTVAFWIRAEAVENSRIPFATAAYGDRCFRFEEDSTGGFAIGLGATGGQHFTRALQPDTWYHVAFAWTEVMYMGWLNGQPVFAGLHDNQVCLDFKDVTLGKGYSDESRRHWKGLMDEVRLYERMLSSDEVLTLKEQKPAP